MAVLSLIVLLEIFGEDKEAQYMPPPYLNALFAIIRQDETDLFYPFVKRHRNAFLSIILEDFIAVFKEQQYKIMNVYSILQDLTAFDRKQSEYHNPESRF